MDCCLDHLVLPTEAGLHRQAEVRGLLLRPHDNKGHLVLDTKHLYISHPLMLRRGKQIFKK